jgi:ABC-2 type transport system ATP-binding protein
MWAKVPAEQHARAIELLQARPEVRAVEELQERLKVTMLNHETDPGIISETLVRAGVTLRGLREDEIGLEEVFMRVTRGETQ